MKINKLVWTSSPFTGIRRDDFQPSDSEGSTRVSHSLAQYRLMLLTLAPMGKWFRCRTHAQLNRFRVSRKAKGDFICNKSSL